MGGFYIYKWQASTPRNAIVTHPPKKKKKKKNPHKKWKREKKVPLIWMSSN